MRHRARNPIGFERSNNWQKTWWIENHILNRRSPSKMDELEESPMWSFVWGGIVEIIENIIKISYW